MRRENKYTAIILFGLFTFPILFQLSHSVWHHSHKHSHVHAHCSGHKHFQDGINYFTQESSDEAHCPICDYQFLLNDIPNKIVYQFNIPLSQFSHSEQEIDLFCRQIYAIKTPRAPPASVVI